MAQETENNDSLKKIDLAHKIRTFHHNSLWEEEKHFTWLISIILSAQIIFYTNNLLVNRDKIFFTLVSSLIGIFLCITAYRVLRREGLYFHTALSRFVKEYNSVNQNSPIPEVSEIANKPILRLIASFFTNKAGVRDGFQLLFLFFILIFIFNSVYIFLIFL